MLGEMVRVMGLFKWYFYRIFKKLMGSMLYEYFVVMGVVMSLISGELGMLESGVFGFEVLVMGSGLDVGLDWNFFELWLV